jgi:hypothetical protein
MPRAEVHADLFKGANRVFKAVPWRRIEVERHNKELEPAQEAARTRGAARRDRQRQQRIKEVGTSPLPCICPCQNLQAPCAACPLWALASFNLAPSLADTPAGVPLCVQAGIDYEYAGVAAKRLSKPTKTRFEDKDA